MRSKPLGLAAALIFWSALSLPCASPAGTITGTWTGFVSFDIEYAVDGVPAGSSSGGYIGEMDLTYDTLDGFASITISGDQGLQVTGSPDPADPFGPTSGAATMIGPPFDYASWEVGNFAVSYQSILPDGTIDTSSGFANGDILAIYTDPAGNGATEYVSFQTIPEPPSIVPAASALLVTAIIGLKRRLRPRQWSVWASSTHT